MSNQTNAGMKSAVRINPIAKICGVDIKSYEEFLEDVHADEAMLAGWNQLPEFARLRFKQYYDGEALPPFTNDAVFKYIFNPDTHPERLSELLSLLIGMPCQVKKALTQENIPLSLYSKKVIMDILVELETGELANVEIQRVVADFSNKRAAVLSSSLLTRQYSILKEQQKAEMDFDKIQKVYTVVFFEDNIPESAVCPDRYLHKSRQTFDTGIKMDLMQEYIFVELNKFRRLVTNLDTKLDGWLKFIITRTPTDIEELIAKFSSFQEVCTDAIMFLNDKGVMLSMILEGLAEVDENSFKNMIKRRDAQIAEVKEENTELKLAVNQKDKEINQKDEEIASLRRLLEEAGINT